MKISINLYLHSIFCTSRHLNLISDKERMRQLLYDSFQYYDCELFESICTTNHVHILHSANPEMGTDELLKKIKFAVQTRYQREIDSNFFWDPGYYVFSIGGDSLENERIKLLQHNNMHKKQSLEAELKNYRDEFQFDDPRELTDLDENRFN